MRTLPIPHSRPRQHLLFRAQFCLEGDKPESDSRSHPAVVGLTSLRGKSVAAERGPVPGASHHRSTRSQLEDGVPLRGKPACNLFCFQRNRVFGHYAEGCLILQLMKAQTEGSVFTSRLSKKILIALGVLNVPEWDPLSSASVWCIEGPGRSIPFMARRD